MLSERGFRWAAGLFLAGSLAVRLALAAAYPGFLTGDDVEILETGFRSVLSHGYVPWEIRNTLASPVMPHLIHFHGRHFQVLQRIGPTGGANLTAYNTVNQGFINAAWKDTVLVMPGETVRLLVRTSDFPGLYVYHCHLLEHEDMGMMRNFRILA